LKNLSEEQLMRVKDFTIWNNYGKIYFEGLTDLTDTNLAEVVTIEQSDIEVYPDELKKLNRYPS
jgi:Nucleoporin autopeptidase